MQDMAKVVVLGVTGESGFWLVDLDAGTVTAMPETVTDPFGYSPEARRSGAVLSAGVDLAVAVPTREGAFSGKYDT
jgi:hypothetical protein